jgi:flagellar motor protein MotB
MSPSHLTFWAPHRRDAVLACPACQLADTLPISLPQDWKQSQRAFEGIGMKSNRKKPRRNTRKQHQRSRPNRASRSKTRPSSLSSARSEVTLAVVKGLVVAIAVAAAACALTIGLHAARVTEPAHLPAYHLIVEQSTSSEAPVVLAPPQRAELFDAGRAHRQIELTVINGSGQVVSDRLIDMTPRIDPSNPSSGVLRVAARADTVINEEVDSLIQDMNEPSEVPGRALYPGLLATTFQPGVPVMIVASAMDTTNPVDARRLAFQVPAAQVVSAVEELPNLADVDVKFLVKGTAGPQPQLRDRQKSYLRTLWSSLLLAGHARSVQFVDLPMGPSATNKITAPIVPVPALPGTPVSVVQAPGRVECQLSASTYFLPDSAELIDAIQTMRDLQPCVSRIGPSAKVQLDGWTAYFGRLTTSGRPIANSPADIELSRKRAVTVAGLLEQMGVASSRITRTTGHGNADQPYPSDPSSDRNRTVRITSE